MRRGEEQHALDNFCGFARLMAPGNNYFLHFRRVHPRPFACGHCCGFDPGHSRQKSARIVLTMQVFDWLGALYRKGKS